MVKFVVTTFVNSINVADSAGTKKIYSDIGYSDILVIVIIYNNVLGIKQDREVNIGCYIRGSETNIFVD